MYVKNRLPPVCIAVKHSPIASVPMFLIIRDDRRATDHVANDAEVVSGEVVERSYMPLGHDKDMHRRLWINVLKCYQLAIFIDECRRDVTSNDFAE